MGIITLTLITAGLLPADAGPPFWVVLSAGIAIGLVAGKAIGVFGASWLLIRLTGASLPAESNTRQFFGVCVLCGIGFTMSLFIGGLAFAGQDPVYETEVKLGVLGGSCCLRALRAFVKNRHCVVIGERYL